MKEEDPDCGKCTGLKVESFYNDDEMEVEK